MSMISKRSTLALALLILGLQVLVGCGSTTETPKAVDGDLDDVTLDGDEAANEQEEQGESEQVEADSSDSEASFVVPADFFSDSGSDVLRLTVRGLINTSADYEAKKATEAWGQVELILGATSTRERSRFAAEAAS